MRPSDQRDMVRRGYDAISNWYRPSQEPISAEELTRYEVWVGELTALLHPGARVLDLGCGSGVPTTRLLVEAGFDVVGLDFSPVQLQRARLLVPGAHFIEGDIANWDPQPGSFDAVVSFYSLIHLPQSDQFELLPRIRRWLAPRGVLLAIIGRDAWTGTADYFGAEMFWDHPDAATFLAWLAAAGFTLSWQRFVPDGDSGHQLILGRSIS